MTTKAQPVSEYLAQLALADDAPPEDPAAELPPDYSVAAEAGSDFVAALRLAGKLAKGVEMIDTYEGGLTQTLGA
jgi:hypothetical protein